MRRFFSDTGTLYGLATILLVTPFVVFRDVPLYDLPNHLASLHVLFGGAPGADRYYAAEWRLVPNLAAEAWVWFLHRFVSVDAALRLFLAATVAQLFWGAVALNRALFGGRNRFALAAALFAYNGPLLFGFIDLSFGLGMALWAVAAWIRWRDEPWALPFFALIACLVLFAHLFAFAVYALVLCAYEFGAAGRGRQHARRGLFALLHLLAPAALYFLAMPHALGGGVAYGSPLLKFAQLASAIGFYNPLFDALSLLALLIAAGLVAHRLAFAHDMMLPLVALAVAYVVLPHQLGSATFVDYRMPATFALFLCGSLAWRESRRRTRAEAFVLALFGLRWLVTMAQFHSWQGDYAEYRAAFALLPQDAKLLPLARDPNAVDPALHPPLAHVDALAVGERGALVPDLFAGLGYELLTYRQPYRALATQTPTAALAPDFDYVLLIRPEELSAAQVPRYREVAAGRTFVLGKLER
ncbi:MAG: hypothetical protein KGL11_04560 [Alphaproteobacteria bacterium]|nr:hypothetical protein [Alphaproteobacteria bacterium]